MNLDVCMYLEPAAKLDVFFFFFVDQIGRVTRRRGDLVAKT